MQSAGLRQRKRPGQDAQPFSQTHNTPSLPHTVPSNKPAQPEPLPKSLTAGHTPPTFTINLSLPPEHRYTHLATALQPTIATTNFESLFTDVLSQALPPPDATPRWLNTIWLLRSLARLVLRRVFSDEENAELVGISRDTGIGMDLLVAFNVVLDVLMGCTSGGVRVQDEGDGEGEGHAGLGPIRVGGGDDDDDGRAVRMLHFRTLDWDMDVLRRLVVELEFVRVAGGPVVARTVGYFGYVGVLTGVREGLSLSLNFRIGELGMGQAGWRKRSAMVWHLVMVLLGRRKGVSSMLRGYLLGEMEARSRAKWWPWSREKEHVGLDACSPTLPEVDAILVGLESSPSTAAYLIFCTPSKVYSVEKGHRSASVRSSSKFLATCNHDVADEPEPGRIHAAAQHVASQGMAGIINESFERKQAIEEEWKKRLRLRQLARWDKGKVEGVALGDVLHMLGHEYISDGSTHYAVVMDPKHGQILWRRVYGTEDLRDDES
jgi:hypothetical protein